MDTAEDGHRLDTYLDTALTAVTQKTAVWTHTNTQQQLHLHNNVKPREQHANSENNIKTAENKFLNQIEDGIRVLIGN